MLRFAAYARANLLRRRGLSVCLSMFVCLSICLWNKTRLLYYLISSPEGRPCIGSVQMHQKANSPLYEKRGWARDLKDGFHIYVSFVSKVEFKRGQLKHFVIVSV